MGKSLISLALAFALLGSGCSFKRLAVNKLGDALSSGGSSFGSEEDPELARAAAPFSLKLMESLLNEAPRHAGLLTAAASGFAQYAYAFVQQDADTLEDQDLQAAEQIRTRARRMYLRARNYGLRGLELRHPHFERDLRLAPQKAVQTASRADVPLLYWTAASWGGAIALSKDNPDSIADIPILEALIDKALELNESYAEGSIHSFLITYEMSRQGAPGDPIARSRAHFERAMALSGGHQAGPLVALAEAVCIQTQDAKEFEALLNRALAINVDAKPEWRLANLVMQRRAKWLLGRVEQLFLRSATPSETPK